MPEAPERRKNAAQRRIGKNAAAEKKSEERRAEKKSGEKSEKNRTFRDFGYSFNIISKLI